jgi:hypothetical protein
MRLQQFRGPRSQPPSGQRLMRGQQPQRPHGQGQPGEGQQLRGQRNGGSVTSSWRLSSQTLEGQRPWGPGSQLVESRQLGEGQRPWGRHLLVGDQLEEGRQLVWGQQSRVPCALPVEGGRQPMEGRKPEERRQLGKCRQSVEGQPRGPGVRQLERWQPEEGVVEGEQPMGCPCAVMAGTPSSPSGLTARPPERPCAWTWARAGPASR